MDGVPQQDYIPFHNIDDQVAAALLDVLPKKALEDRQNYGPTLEAVLDACAHASGVMRLSGYGIGPQRSDERLTIDGIWVHDPDLADYALPEVYNDSCQCKQVQEIIFDLYDLDPMGTPDETSHMRMNWSEGPVGTWLWWD